LKITWTEFRDRYEREVLASLADRTGLKVGTIFNSVEDVLSPRLLSCLTTERLSHFQTVLRERGKAEDTIKGSLAHLKAALRWAGGMGLLHSIPKVIMPRRAKGSKVMKGRAIVTEEFERILSQVRTVCCRPLLRERTRMVMRIVRARSQDDPVWLDKLDRKIQTTIQSWQFLLRGLWWSGLRIDESLNLTWDEPNTIRIDTSGRYVMLRISAGSEKGHRDRLYPVTPEFADMILAVPESDRKGHFFQPLGVRGQTVKYFTAVKTVSAIGKRANVVVDSDGGKIKYASAHDLRRAFGFRWSERVMPPLLKELMRHECINTTLTYYVGINADATASKLYEAVGRTPESNHSGDTSGDTWANAASRNEKGSTQL
jgi:integrase